jgi:hypothetical protein
MRSKQQVEALAEIPPQFGGIRILPGLPKSFNYNKRSLKMQKKAESILTLPVNNIFLPFCNSSLS